MHPGATIQEAARRIGETGHHRLVVVDARDRPVGIVSSLDIVRGLIGMFETKGLGVLLAAPTGRAAKRMESATGHRAFRIIT